MTVGVLLITHTGVGSSLLEAAAGILSAQPELTSAIDVPGDSDPDTVFEQALGQCRKFDQGNGVLVMTDLYGSTPSNIATRLPEHHNVVVISGVNLPMLVRALNYHTLPLDEVAGKAVSGGRDGVTMTIKKQAS